MMQDLAFRQLASVGSLPAAGSSYDGVIVRVGNKAWYCNGSAWIEITKRDFLIADRTYYVSTSGSDTNNGLGQGVSISAWDIQHGVYSGNSLDVYTQRGNQVTVDLCFSADGTRAYFALVDNVIYQYNLSTEWDLSTATYASKSLSTTAQSSLLRAIAISSDGTKLYAGNNTAIYQYTLSTAWDLSTASYASKSMSITGQMGSPQSLVFGNGGTKAYVCSNSNDTIYQYNLSTAWDISTGSYAIKSFSVGSLDTTTYTCHIKDDGTKLYAIGQANDRIYIFSLSTAWDISTATDTGLYFSTASQQGEVNGLFIRPDGLGFYTCGTQSSIPSCHQFNITPSTGTDYPFQTIQKAIDTVAALDLNGFMATIKLADGTYTAANTLKRLTGGECVIEGNTTTPANVVVSTTSANCFTAEDNFSEYTLKALKLQTSTSGYAVSAFGPSKVNIDSVNFGAVGGSSSHLLALEGATIEATGNYTISGGAYAHVEAQHRGGYRNVGKTLTISGTPAFSGAFAAVLGGFCSFFNSVFSGSATGTRYSVTVNGAIRTNSGASSTYLPGNAAGSAATGGQYV